MIIIVFYLLIFCIGIFCSIFSLGGISYFFSRWIQAKPQEIYVTVAWLSWVPNLIIAEWLISIGITNRLLKKKLFVQE